MKSFLFVLAILVGVSTTVDAQSLWQHRNPRLTNMYADTAARRVGDLVTIVVNEATDVENRDQRQLAKSTDTQFNLDFSATGDVGSGAGTFDFQKNSNREFDGQSQYSVAQEFTDQITVQLLDSRPNGNLVVGGRRTRTVGGELRTLVISGVIRTLDINPNNSVSSRHVANFKICYEGDGPESSFTTQGWAGRLVNKIWPF